MTIIDRFHEQARQNPRRIVFPEGEDPRILEAAARARDLGIATPILIGDPDTLAAAAAEAGVDLAGIEITGRQDEARLAGYAEAYAAERDLKVSIAAKLVRKPLSFGGMMVASGDADGMVAGVASATASVIQAASLTIGFQEGISTPSSFFLMVIPECLGERDKVLVFADCAVTVQPDSRQLAEIGVAAGRNARDLLGIEPKIAFLSFSTKGSANHADIDKVAAAVDIARELDGTLAMDGELQGDAALVARVGSKKAPDSTVAGHANVLVFPDLDAANIAYKLVQYLANAMAIGPILQGFRRPVNDMSRGATVDDLVNVTAITVVQAQAE